MTRWYRVVHATTYTYEVPVNLSYGRAHVLPRDVTGVDGRALQTVLDRDLTVSPDGTVLRSVDFYGNESAYVEVSTDHTVLNVTATSTLRLDRAVPDLARAGVTVAEAARWVTAPEQDPAATLDFRRPSPRLPDLQEPGDYAREVLAPDRPVGEAVLELTHRIHDDFPYRSGSTNVRSTVTDLLTTGAGVCQDFAHLAVVCLRRAGLAARYVSGYLETVPPPGKVKQQGADASHAWASVLLPGLGWVDIDPTNRKLADESFVTTAWGRDYGDVPPLRGLVFSNGSGGSRLSVGVDVIPVDEPAVAAET